MVQTKMHDLNNADMLEIFDRMAEGVKEDFDLLKTEGQLAGLDITDTECRSFGCKDWIAYLPSCGRGVWITNGGPEWFDASSLSDAIDQVEAGGHLVTMDNSPVSEIEIDIFDVIRDGDVNAAIKSVAIDAGYKIIDHTETDTEQNAKNAVNDWINSYTMNYTPDPSDALVIDLKTGMSCAGIDEPDECGWTGNIVWSEGSVIEIVLPDDEDAIENPLACGAMAEAALTTHLACSDVKGWARLVDAARKISSAVSGLEISSNGGEV